MRNIWKTVLQLKLFNVLHKSLRPLCATFIKTSSFHIYMRYIQKMKLGLLCFLVTRSHVRTSIPASLHVLHCRPKYSYLFHVEFVAGLLLLLYFFCVKTMARGTRERESAKEGGIAKHENGLKKQPVQLCATWMYNSFHSIHFQHRAPHTSNSLILS